MTAHYLPKDALKLDEDLYDFKNFPPSILSTVIDEIV